MPPGDTLPAGYCHNCGYDLRGTPGLHCPECNTDRRQSSTALLERAAVWSVMDLPRWGSRVRAMVRILAWPPAALRPGEPLTRWRHPELRVLVWVIAAYLLVEFVAHVPLIGRIIGSWEVFGWLGWQERVLFVPKFMAFQCLLWLTLARVIGWLYCRACKLNARRTRKQLSVLIMVAFPFCQAIRTMVALLPFRVPGLRWEHVDAAVYVAFGAYVFVLASRILGYCSRSNQLRFLVVAILTLTWWFELDLWLLFYRLTLWIRSFTGPEVY